MESHSNILAQLTELKKWHEQHCTEEEEETGNSMAGTLSAEDQAKIYRILGLSPSFISEIETSQSHAINGHQLDMNNSSPSPRESEDKNLHLIHNNLSGKDQASTLSADAAGQPSVTSKRPFLKRGEGLTNRFKVHPDNYKLKNLPKYKFSSTKRPKRAPASAASANEQIEEVVPFDRYRDKTRKSCLKQQESTVTLEQLRVQMTELCTNAINKVDSSGESEMDVPNSNSSGTAGVNDDNVKRMLDFSRKSPKVTFDAEVVRIPFENYFHRESNDSESDEDQEEEAINNGADIESLRLEFNVDTVFQKNAVSSTPVEIFKENHIHNASAEKSPRTVLVEKGSLLREKLKELEQEAQTFKEQNHQVQKMKQILELERIELQKERQDMERNFKEQHRLMELHFEKLHEEVDQERVTLKQRSMVPSKKLKEETDSLRARIDELERDVKNRELKHGASQTRLRTHIRTLEKENKEHVTAIETLKKENKRLEAENSRLMRQKNNKMLLEINKNIAKLATTTSEQPQAQEHPQETKRAMPKKTVPKRSASQKGPLVAATKATVKSSEVSDLSITSADDEESEESKRPQVGNGPSNYFPKVRLNGGLGAEKENERREGPKDHDKPQLNESSGAKREIINDDGSRDVYYPNGNLKKISADGMIVKVLYFNKDIKETDINEGTVKYYYAETKTWHTSFLDGLEILEFPSGQTEHRFKNGKIEIYFPNGLVRVTNPKDNEVLEEWRYPDGTIVLETKSKEKIIKMPNGQKEIHTVDDKRREYPDGTVKIVYADGRTETRYSNGRIRIKDKDGRLVSDSQNVS